MFGFLVLVSRVVAFDDEPFERGHAAPFTAILKGNQGAVVSLTETGDSAGLDQGIPTILPEVALCIQEQAGQVAGGQVFGFGISG